MHNRSMFRRRLTGVLAVLAAAALVQGIGAVTALRVTEQQVERGRVASDIHRGFIELSAVKQRLHTWVAQRKIGDIADIGVRDELQAELRRLLEQLKALSVTAIAMGDGTDASRVRQVQRQDALTVLEENLRQLEAAVADVQPLPPGVDALQAWRALSEVFEQSRGRDLRLLIADSKAREEESVRRERERADAALARARTLWLTMSLTLALAGLAAALYFGRALRRPLAELSDGAQALQQGQLSHRIPLDGNDEFSAVARSMNAMASELDLHRGREAQQRQRLEDEVAGRTAELRRALEALQQADVRRRQLFADISHELRTPTTAIRGEAEVTLRGVDRPAAEYRAALTRIVETSRQLGNVIDDLLLMARSDLDRLALERRPLDLAALCADALAQAGALAEPLGVRLLPLVAPDKPCLVLADEQRLRQLLLILLDNAIHYSRTAGTVEIRVATSGGASSQWWVEVRDEGIGIAAGDLPRVFDRHFRGASARQYRPDGSGLGLPIARALAQAHGGSVELRSAPGQGTVARLSLPALQPSVLEQVA